MRAAPATPNMWLRPYLPSALAISCTDANNKPSLSRLLFSSLFRARLLSILRCPPVPICRRRTSLSVPVRPTKSYTLWKFLYWQTVLLPIIICTHGGGDASTPPPQEKSFYLGGWGLFSFFLRCMYLSMRAATRDAITPIMISLTKQKNVLRTSIISPPWPVYSSGGTAVASVYNQ